MLWFPEFVMKETVEYTSPECTQWYRKIISVTIEFGYHLPWSKSPPLPQPRLSKLSKLQGTKNPQQLEYSCKCKETCYNMQGTPKQNHLFGVPITPILQFQPLVIHSIIVQNTHPLQHAHLKIGEDGRSWEAFFCCDQSILWYGNLSSHRILDWHVTFSSSCSLNRSHQSRRELVCCSELCPSSVWDLHAEHAGEQVGSSLCIVCMGGW